ncbi:MAG: hypothetical protein P8H03_08915, partial [Emcibacteraceae bacterium]|nr:hypothetical protein [Emcibacteraceae bacterium]
MIKRFITALAASLLLITSAFAADVDGEWDIMLSASEGAATVPMSITVDGEIAKAMADGEELVGTYKDGELKLEGPYYVPEAGMSSTLDINATLEGDE